MESIDWNHYYRGGINSKYIIIVIIIIIYCSTIDQKRAREITDVVESDALYNNTYLYIPIEYIVLRTLCTLCPNGGMKAITINGLTFRISEPT